MDEMTLGDICIGIRYMAVAVSVAMAVPGRSEEVAESEADAVMYDRAVPLRRRLRRPRQASYSATMHCMPLAHIQHT